MDQLNKLRLNCPSAVLFRVYGWLRKTKLIKNNLHYHQTETNEDGDALNFLIKFVLPSMTSNRTTVHTSHGRAVEISLARNVNLRFTLSYRNRRPSYNVFKRSVPNSPHRRIQNTLTRDYKNQISNFPPQRRRFYTLSAYNEVRVTKPLRYILQVAVRYA